MTVWIALVIEKVRACVAGLKTLLPDCEAFRVQLPIATSATVKPFTLQVAGVVVASVIGRPELALGATTSGPPFKGVFAGLAKVTVCATLATVNERGTDSAGA